MAAGGCVDTALSACITHRWQTVIRGLRDIGSRQAFLRQNGWQVDGGAGVCSLGQVVGAGLRAMTAPSVGAVIGTADVTGLDALSGYLLTRADEALNREEYREDVVNTIEEEKTEMFSMIQRTSD